MAWVPGAVRSLSEMQSVVVDGIGRFEPREVWRAHRATPGIAFTPAPRFADLPGLPARVREERRVVLPGLGELEWVAAPAGVSGPVASPHVRFRPDPALLARIGSSAAQPSLSTRTLERFPSLREVPPGKVAAALDRIALQTPARDDLDLVVGEAAHDAALARLVMPVLVERVSPERPEMASVLFLGALSEVGPWAAALDQASIRALTGPAPALQHEPALAWLCRSRGQADLAEIALDMLSGDPPTCRACGAELEPTPAPPTELSGLAAGCGLDDLATLLAWAPTGHCTACDAPVATPG